MQNGQPTQVRHAILTCYDPRIDHIVDGEIQKIRSEGGLLTDKDIFRPPGGVHLFTGKSDCRAAFYTLLDNLHQIAGTAVLHLWPHTNCVHCGIHHREKIGSGAQSDLGFHTRSAEKMRDGVMRHFANVPQHAIPTLDVRVILTIDQRIVTIPEAHELLPGVPLGLEHGAPCLGHSSGSIAHGQRLI